MTVVDIPEDVHRMIIKKQSKLYEIEEKKTNISEIAARAITKGIDLI